MNLQERFDLTYVDADGSKKRPVMLHRVIYGSVERFIGILIEHFAGAFPLWLNPVGVNVIPVKNELHLEYANKVKECLENKGIRVSLDDRDEKVGYKMRESVMNKINYTLVIGDKEKENNSVTYRKRGSEEQISVSLEEFAEMLVQEIKDKAL